MASAVTKISDVLKYKISDTPRPEYGASDLPKFALGAAILVGGVYGITKLLLHRREAEELETLTDLKKEELARAPASVSPVVRGALRGRGQYR